MVLSESVCFVFEKCLVQGDGFVELPLLLGQFSQVAACGQDLWIVGVEEATRVPKESF